MDDNNGLENEKIIITRSGKKIVCDVLFTFECEENNRVYIGYTDNTVGLNNEEPIYVSYFDPTVGTSELFDITTEEETEMIHEVLNQIHKKIK